MKVLVEEKFYRDGGYSGFWCHCYEAKVLAETDDRYKVKKSFFHKAEWLPKNGMYIRIKKIK